MGRYDFHPQRPSFLRRPHLAALPSNLLRSPLSSSFVLGVVEVLEESGVELEGPPVAWGLRLPLYGDPLLRRQGLFQFSSTPQFQQCPYFLFPPPHVF